LANFVTPIDRFSVLLVLRMVVIVAVCRC